MKTRSFFGLIVLALLILLGGIWTDTAANLASTSGVSTVAQGEIHISGTSATSINHGDSITISGSEFGGKDPAAPLQWDDGEGRTLRDPATIETEGGWAESWPGPAMDVREWWKVQYREVGYRDVAAPHSHSSNYIAGGHWNDHDDMGRNVAVTADAGSASNNWYASWYVRLDPQWPTDDDACFQVGNYKDFVFQSGGASYTPGGEFRYSACTTCIVRREEEIEVNVQQICGKVYDAARRPSEVFDWRRREVLVQRSPGLLQTFSYDGATRIQSYNVSCQENLVDWGIRSFSIGGFMKNSDAPDPVWHPEWYTVRDLSDDWYDWQESSTPDEYYVKFAGGDGSDAPWVKVQPCKLTIGGQEANEGTAGSLDYGEWDYGDFDGLGYDTVYVRLPEGIDPRDVDSHGPCYVIAKDDRLSSKGNGRTHPDAFRYFDDLYVDNTFSRVVLANSQNYEESTIVEPQIPSGWSNTFITVTVNLGKLKEGETAYIFVFDADNNHNPVGYPITIGPALILHGASQNQAIHLTWTVNITLPVTTTWHIDYYTQTASVYTATDPLSVTRSHVLTENVDNYDWYTVTLHAIVDVPSIGETSWLSDTVRVMPTDKFVYLPLVLR